MESAQCMTGYGSFSHGLAVRLNMHNQRGASVEISPKADLICSH